MGRVVVGPVRVGGEGVAGSDLVSMSDPVLSPDSPSTRALSPTDASPFVSPQVKMVMVIAGVALGIADVKESSEKLTLAMRERTTRALGAPGDSQPILRGLLSRGSRDCVAPLTPSPFLGVSIVLSFAFNLLLGAGIWVAGYWGVLVAIAAGSYVTREFVLKVRALLHATGIGGHE